MIDFTACPSTRPSSQQLEVLDSITCRQAANVSTERLRSRGLALIPYNGGYRVVPIPATTSD